MCTGQLKILIRARLNSSPLGKKTGCLSFSLRSRSTRIHHILFKKKETPCSCLVSLTSESNCSKGTELNVGLTWVKSQLILCRRLKWLELEEHLITWATLAEKRERRTRNSSVEIPQITWALEEILTATMRNKKSSLSIWIHRWSVHQMKIRLHQHFITAREAELVSAVTFLRKINNNQVA